LISKSSFMTWFPSQMTISYKFHKSTGKWSSLYLALCRLVIKRKQTNPKKTP
jgi:cytochrome b561